MWEFDHSGFHMKIIGDFLRLMKTFIGDFLSPMLKIDKWKYKD